MPGREARGSSRSARRCSPGRRTRPRRSPACRGPPRRRRPRPRGPAGPPPTITRSHIAGGAPREPSPAAPRELGVGRVAQHAARRDHDAASRRARCASARSSAVRLLVLLEVEPLVGHAVAREELAQRAACRARSASRPRVTPAPRSIRIERRAMNAPQDQVAELLVLGDERAQRAAAGTWMTSPASRTTAVRYARRAGQQVELAEEAMRRRGPRSTRFSAP